MPKSDGMFHCEDECDFKTSNVFELFDHCGIEFEWSIKVSKNYSFNIYKCLEALMQSVDEGDAETAYQIIQDTAILLANAGSGELDDFIEELEVKEGFKNALDGLERMLKENG